MKKRRPPSKRLLVSTEKVRELQPDQLQEVGGGCLASEAPRVVKPVRDNEFVLFGD